MPIEARRNSEIRRKNGQDRRFIRSTKTPFQVSALQAALQLNADEPTARLRA